MGLFENTDKLPNKLENNYIYEAIIELRYQPTVPVELMAVKLDDTLGNEYSHPIKVLDVPDFIKQNIPEYNNAICYVIKNIHNFFSIGIGAGLISLRITNFSYGTWKVFIDEFKKIYDKIHNYVDRKEQIGVRYINVFNGNVLPKLNLDINISSESIIEKPLVLSWQVKEDDRTIKASVTSVATVNYTNFKSGQNEIKKDVSIFDIDCIYRNINGINNDIFEDIETNHNIIKKYFFGICKKDFINDELKPIDGE